MALRAARSAFNTESLSLLQNTFTGSFTGLFTMGVYVVMVLVWESFSFYDVCEVTFRVIMRCIKMYVLYNHKSIMVLYRGGNRILDMI